MKTISRLLTVAIAAAALLAMSRSTQISASRAKLARLQANAALSSASPAPAVSAGAQAEIVRLRAENRDIYKLRGQITQAREKRKELEQLQADNAQLRQQIARLKSSPPEPSPLANKGQGTPEAALETAFWTMSRGDLEGLAQLMPGALSGIAMMEPAERTNTVTVLRAMASTIQKLQVIDQKFDTPDEAQLTVRIIPREGMGPAVFPSRQSTIPLRRTNGIWQIAVEGAGGFFGL